MAITMMQDKCPAIRFGKVAREDRNATIEAGRLITTDVDVVYVKQIGEKDEIEKDARDYLEQLRNKAYGSNGNAPSVPVEWYERAEKIYENFKKGFENQPDGFPVREWPILTPAQVSNMHSMQTFTVEQVAAWNESALAMFGMGGRELREKAKTWLASGDEKAEKIRAQEVRIADLESTLAKMQQQIATFMESANEDKPQRGRPRKEAEAA